MDEVIKTKSHQETFMNKIKATAIATGLIVLAGGAWFYSQADASEATTFRYGAVEQGDLSSTVSATGALNAVRTVQVGTQVSGQVSAIYVDFNDRVKKGQLLARIDPTLAQQAVEDAQAQVERVQAQLTQAQGEYQRNKTLFDERIVTATEFGTAESNYQVQQAAMKQARVALDRARKNLSYTNIYAPIDGVIVERNVDVGQTVAASLSAPQLFLIANDLSEMQILASVDESDIGAIKEGQEAKFTVQTYPNDNFSGTVKQVRLQSTTADNVVNYTAVVAVQNPTGKLLPGMTATVEFLTSSAKNVMTVPNAALRFRPDSAMLRAAGVTSANRGDSAARAARFAAARTAGTAGSNARPGASAARAGSTRGSRGTLWYTDATGKLKASRVTLGLSDGQRTQVTGDSVQPGMKIIIGSNAAGSTAATAEASANPFQGGQRRRGF
jgi:HlyD family secretion protein